MIDHSHLDALELRLSHERSHLTAAKTHKERALRAVWIAQIEKEIANERKFLGLPDDSTSSENMTDDELLAQLKD
jgi:hypothetical protein